MIGKPGAAKIVEIFLRSLFGLSLCLSLAIVKLGTGSSAIRFQISLQVLGEEGGTSMFSLPTEFSADYLKLPEIMATGACDLIYRIGCAFRLFLR